jgi:hypothetical protein
MDNEGIAAPKKPLYAIAIEKRIRITSGRRKGHLRVETGIEYLHATDAREAHFLFCLAWPNRFTHHIVSIGVAVAYFVEDKKGIVLSVS